MARKVNPAWKAAEMERLEAEAAYTDLQEQYKVSVQAANDRITAAQTALQGIPQFIEE